MDVDPVINRTSTVKFISKSWTHEKIKKEEAKCAI